jgi:hypothetical protein
MGPYERAFFGNQFSRVAPLFAEAGVQLWLPEVGGPPDPEVDELDELMALLGILAKREVIRARARTRNAMTAQVRTQGRYVGGRVPRGYLLVSAGPHPNKADARWGRRLQKFAVDPATGPTVVWIFQMRRAGRTVARIVRALTDAGIPCPSAADPDAIPHRAGMAWTVRTVQEVLANPVYTGRMVWNRQRTERVLVDPANPGLGHREVRLPRAESCGCRYCLASVEVPAAGSQAVVSGGSGCRAGLQPPESLEISGEPLVPDAGVVSRIALRIIGTPRAAASGPCLVEDGRPDSPGLNLLLFLRESGDFLLSFP